jgi:hypothetical protein
LWNFRTWPTKKDHFQGNADRVPEKEIFDAGIKHTSNSTEAINSENIYLKSQAQLPGTTDFVSNKNIKI